APRQHDRDPALRRPLALAHTGFRRLLSKWLVRENPHEQLAATLGKARNSDTRSLDLAVGDPCRFHGLQTVFAESQVATAPGLAVAPAAHLLSVLHLLGHQHRCVLASLISPRH